MVEILKKNISYIIRQWLIVTGSLFSLLSIFLSFISWEDIGITGIMSKFFIFTGLLILGFLVSLIWICFFKKKNHIISEGAAKVNICYGDLMKIAFPKKSGRKKIVVISVNTAFDTIVDDDLALYDKPLVSPNTIHGRWINNMVKNGITIASVDSNINNYIQKNNIMPVRELTRMEKPRGNLKDFDNGTIVIAPEYNGITFFLLALSEFDKNNEAQSTKDDVIKCLKKLLSFYSSNGQGFEMYLTLMGTGRSRAGLTHEESLQTIKSVLSLYKQKIQGTINVVVYNKDKGKVSIFD